MEVAAQSNSCQAYDAAPIARLCYDHALTYYVALHKHSIFWIFSLHNSY
jgi:hypothetical protein